MQEVRLWEVTSDEKLTPIPNNEINLEERLEGWLANDISVLDPNLLVIGSQVQTDFGGRIDLLCLDSNGDAVIVELKKGKTPREVAAQALDYASWVRGLGSEKLTSIADRYLGDSGPLKSAFQQRFEREFPEEINVNHRSLIVAESIDASTERIVLYLSDMKVPINVATVQHFKDKDGKSILAQVYLIDPEEAEAKPSPTPRRAKRPTLKDLQEMANKNAVGALFDQVRNGVRSVLSPEPYENRVWYKLRRKEGGFRTVLIVDTTPHMNSGGSGLGFRVHATRLKEHLNIDLQQLKTWLPATSCETEKIRGWSGSSEDERNCAIGLEGYLQSKKEVEKFVAEFRNAIVQSRTS